MLNDLRQKLQTVVSEALRLDFPAIEQTEVEIEVPADHQHGEFATNIAMKSARLLRRSPMQIAEDFIPRIQKGLAVSDLKDSVAKIEAKAPGFINFFLSRQAFYEVLLEVFDKQERFGAATIGQGVKWQIEFVSANPTGPLSVAHARQAAVGDALGNILAFLGFDVTKEYYVNDEGNQINLLGRSIAERAREMMGMPSTFPDEGYQGEYVKDMARRFLTQEGIQDGKQLCAVSPESFVRFGVDYLLHVIKEELSDFGVTFDVWTHQSAVATLSAVDKAIEELREQELVYESDGALWFRSSRYGDDKDRVLKKRDGAYTYFAPDIVYHRDKFARGFAKVVNIWGPDHHGYIPRLTAAVEALGQPREALKVLIVQLATIYRQGQKVSMSTRGGQYISLREVMEDVGTDAARFFFLLRHITAHLDFDLDLAKEESPENPVYYIQYAHARLCSIIAKAQAEQLAPQETRLSLLQEPEELRLMKVIGDFPDVLVNCYHELDPFALVAYLLELATVFHKFYDRHRVVDTEHTDISRERLALIAAVRIVLANGLRLIGVHAPERM